MIRIKMIDHQLIMNSLDKVKDSMSLAIHGLSLRVSDAIDMDFKHQVSEVFTSGDISLPNIVMSLGCKSFETCQIRDFYMTCITYMLYRNSW